jgi:DNA modification methylase
LNATTWDRDEMLRRGGRFPANLVHVPKASRKERERGTDGLPTRTGAEAVNRAEGSPGSLSPGAGAGRKAREIRNFHPTVKPVCLLRWLVRLVTPPGGLVLDPFAGSGSCGVAAVLEGFTYVGVEIDPAYHPIAEARIRHALVAPDAWNDTAPGTKATSRSG